MQAGCAPLFSNLSVSGGKYLYPSPPTLTNARTVLRWNFLIPLGSAFPSPEGNIPRSVVPKNKATSLYVLHDRNIYQTYWAILPRPECLRFPLWSPIKDIFRVQSLPFHVSRSPQYRCSISRKFGVPSRGSLSPYSPHSVLIELLRRQSPLLLSLEVPGKHTWPPGSTLGPLWREMHVSTSSLICPSGPPSK